MDIVLHICCANCAIFPLQVLRRESHGVTGFFSNSNIHPYQEFRRRLDTVKEFAEKESLAVHYREVYRLEEFLAAVAAAPEARCDYCYRSRLAETARFAREAGYPAFSTTLLYSRYQNHDLIRRYGEELAAAHGLQFVYRDFRQGWQEGIRISKALGLYRQQYCGCIYSEKDRYHPSSDPR